MTEKEQNQNSMFSNVVAREIFVIIDARVLTNYAKEPRRQFAFQQGYVSLDHLAHDLTFRSSRSIDAYIQLSAIDSLKVFDIGSGATCVDKDLIS